MKDQLISSHSSLSVILIAFPLAFDQSYKTEELMDVNQATTDLLMSNFPGFDLIHGHTHRQKTHNEEKYTRYVLGDWSSTKGNAIKITDKLEWLEIN